MQGGFFSYALLAALATGLLVAAFTDLQRRQIDNWLTAGIALTAPLFWFAAGLTLTDMAFQIGLALVVFFVTALLFAMRQMGGGDVKLLAAIALWIAPLAFVKLIVLMGLVGGGASIAAAAFNLKRREGEAARDMMGTAAAFVWVTLCGWVSFAIMSGRPVISAEGLSAISGFFAEPWVLLAALGAIAIVVILGLTHVVRRQKSRLRIPYGVAISVAGLWVIASQYIPVLRSTGLTG